MCEDEDGVDFWLWVSFWLSKRISKSWWSNKKNLEGGLRMATTRKTIYEYILFLKKTLKRSCYLHSPRLSPLGLDEHTFRRHAQYRDCAQYDNTSNSRLPYLAIRDNAYRVPFFFDLIDKPLFFYFHCSSLNRYYYILLLIIIIDQEGKLEDALKEIRLDKNKGEGGGILTF